jgi:hypothetical protein
MTISDWEEFGLRIFDCGLGRFWIADLRFRIDWNCGFRILDCGFFDFYFHL